MVCLTLLLPSGILADMQHILCFMLWKSLSGGLHKSLLTSLCTLNWDIQNNCVVSRDSGAWGTWGLRAVCCWWSPKMSMSQSVPVGFRARGQSLALSVFSSIDIVENWTQRQSLQQGVRGSYNLLSSRRTDGCIDPTALIRFTISWLKIFQFPP